MPSMTINGQECSFEPGQTVLQVANASGVAIPYYCYHDGLSMPAQCRICLAEMWAPNPRNDNTLEPLAGGKLMPTCTQPAQEGMVVRSDSPASVSNQKSVMEYLLINHPLDCPVCDQAGECELQDYSYKYGRGSSRFQESKVKQAKKDLGSNVYIYSDRCIMCTRCVRFTKEVSGTGELVIAGRGNKSEIDVFPGIPLDNELSANVIDLCPVGALLDKDFLFAQRVWFLKSTPSIDPFTASGDNILIEHNEGKIYRFKPRTNLAVNKHWITDEVRYGWKFVHSDDRLTTPQRRRYGTLVEADWNGALDQAVEGIKAARDGQGEGGKRLAVVVSPMLTCEDAYALATAARAIDPEAVLAVGAIPVKGEDKVFPPTASRDDANAFVMHAEKAPNARGVRRVLEAIAGEGNVPDFHDVQARIGGGEYGAVLLTGNYPEAWVTDDLRNALNNAYVVVIDTLPNRAFEAADVVLCATTFAEKAGTFENANGRLQSFEQAVPRVGVSKSEGQIALDLLSVWEGNDLGRVSDAPKGVYIVDDGPGQVPTATSAVLTLSTKFNAADTRASMAQNFDGLGVFVTDVHAPPAPTKKRVDMPEVEL